MTTMATLRDYQRYLDLKHYRHYIRYEPSSFKSYLKESVLLILFGWMPGLLGGLLRGIVYRLLFAKVGRLVFIAAGVDICSAQSIEVGKLVKIQRAVSLNGCSEAARIRLGDSVYIDHGADIRVHDCGSIDIGDNTYIGPYVCMAGTASVQIGKNCLIGAHAGIYSSNHIFDHIERPINQQGNTAQGISIGDDCWLGTGVKVLDGVSIGHGSVIGAGAVVAKDIPPYSVAVGVPAKVISKREVKSSETSGFALKE